MTANPDLRARVEVLEEIVAGLGERLGYGQDPVPPGPWVWHRLGSAERVHRMNQLRVWVDWLTGRYNLHGTATRIAPCWYRHPVAVEELTALWVSWQAAYTLPDPTAELIAWHDRWLWPSLHRLNTAPLQLFNSCPQRHKDAALVAPTTDSDDFADFLGTLGQQPPSETTTTEARTAVELTGRPGGWEA